MNLQHRQTLIQEKKKQTSWDDFIMQIASRYPLVLYKRHGEVSLYPETTRSCPIIAHGDFIKQIDTLTQYGREYDTTKSFFENFRDLFLSMPFSRLYNYSGSENSDFSFSVFNSKNCYLSFTVITDCENILYSFAVKEGCKNIISSSQISNQSENVYQSHCIISSFAVFYSRFIENSSNIRFSSNLTNCQECLLCDGLENQNYCIENKKYSKEEYEQRKKEILADKETYDQIRHNVSSQGTNHRSTDINDCNFVVNSHHVSHGQYCFNLEHAHNTLIVGSPHQNIDIYDAFEAGSLGNSNFYGVLNTGVKSEHIYNSEGIVTCYMVFYSRFLENCKYCIGCIGLRNKEYCILNTQYTKEEWHEKINDIFGQMESDGSLGEFFPASLNPFYFNDTIAQLIYPQSKEEVTAAGYLRRDEAIKVDIPTDADIVQSSNLDQFESFDREGNRTISADILKKVIQDESGDYYRIIPMEYKFLMRHGLPLPRKHWLERMKQNFRMS